MTRLSAEDWIDAGFRALATGGLKAEALARDLGTTKGSFYWHFKDMPDYRRRLTATWRDLALGEIAAAATATTATDLLYRLAEPVPHEAAMRAWAGQDHTVATVVAAVDAARRAALTAALAALGLRNPDFTYLVEGARAGMVLLTATDGLDRRGAVSTLMAALTALSEA